MEIFDVSLQRKPGREGHPWIFRSELRSPPRTTGWIRTTQGDLAYYRAGATLAARLLPGLKNPADLASWATLQIGTAAEKRPSRTSSRIFHGEADGISGLVVDRYVLANGPTLFVLQLQNATAELLRPHLHEILAELFPAMDGLILRLDSRSRAQDGLETKSFEILHPHESLNEADLRRAKVRVVRGEAQLDLECDLLEGQKTGLFLDQVENAFGFSEFLARSGIFKAAATIEVLDLFCYVGLWSAAIGARFPTRAKGWDRSEGALGYYASNVARVGHAETLRADFFQTIQTPEGRSPELKYDLVICDPPALIPSRNDLERGKNQYRRAFSYAFQATRPGGLCVLSSCSQLLSEEDFDDLLPKGGLQVWRGNQSSDHPVPANFPEARYLKCVGIRRAV